MTDRERENEIRQHRIAAFRHGFEAGRRSAASIADEIAMTCERAIGCADEAAAARAIAEKIRELDPSDAALRENP